MICMCVKHVTMMVISLRSSQLFCQLTDTFSAGVFVRSFVQGNACDMFEQRSRG